MILKEKNTAKKSAVSIVLYVAAVVVALIGVALLINNVLLFKNTVNQYVAQGYPAADVIKQLVPSQLIPGILQPVGVYLGIAFILFGTGIINQKVSGCLIHLTDDEICNNANEQVEAAGQTEIAEENSEVAEENK